jgi:ubiquinone/menaquinone biosynthesis C-methylase UbiE
LTLSDAEIERYQVMAEAAERRERDLWVAAGAVPGARIAEVGCGPGAITVRLAKTADPDGAVRAVNRDDDALSVASVPRKPGRGCTRRQGPPTPPGCPSALSTW